MCRVAPPPGSSPLATPPRKPSDPKETQVVEVIFTCYAMDLHARVDTVRICANNHNSVAIFKALKEMRCVVHVEQKMWEPHVARDQLKEHPLAKYYLGFGNHSDINVTTLKAPDWFEYVYGKLSTTYASHIGKFTFKIEPVDMRKDADVYSSFDDFLAAVKALPEPSDEGVLPEDVPDLKRRIVALEAAMADVQEELKRAKTS